MSKVLKGSIEVEGKHTFKVNLEDLVDLDRYDIDDIDQLMIVLKEDIKMHGIEALKGYRLELDDYDIDELKLKIEDD